MRRRTKSIKKSGALLATALLTGSFMSSLAGETISKPDGGKIVADIKPDGNPLSFADGRIVFDLQERVRWELRDNNFDFNDDINALTDDNWLLQRFRIGVMVRPTDWFRIYVQGQDSREINSDRPDFPGLLGAEGDDAFDLRQAYLEFSNYKEFPLGLKIGRQVLSYGDERLIGAFDWNNIGRTFDAVKIRFEQPKWWLDAFASSVVVPERGSYNQSDFFNGNELDRDQVFAGVYFSTSALGPQVIDLYALYLHENTNPRYFPTALGDSSFATLGVRIKSKPGAFAPPPDTVVATDGKTVVTAPAAPRPVGLDYDAELAFQTGEVRGMDLTAFAAHAGVGYTFDASWLPRIAVEYNYASGDSDPLDTDVETFQNLFPTNHKFYGYMDLFSWQNIHNPAVSLRVQPTKTLSVQLDYHAFWLATTDDAWYRANGVTAVRPVTPTSRSADSYAGSEVDLTVTWNARKWLQIQAGYSHFFAGDYLEDTGPSDDADFAYVMATVTF
jgi:hypothetical protein